MANNKLKIEGAAASGAMKYIFCYDDISQQYRLSPINRLRGVDMYVGAVNSLHRVVYLQPPVFSVRVQPYPTIANVNGTLNGDDLDGVPPLMVTEQLTGCSFVFQAVGGNMTAMHVQPAGADPNGRLYQLALMLRNTYDFNVPNNAGPYRVFGSRPAENPPYDYEGATRAMQMVGVIIGGAWQIHVQARNRGTMAGEITNSWQVL